jgi:segregation and condensation protein B
MKEVLRKTEAILFAGSKRMSVEEIQKYLPEFKSEEINAALMQLQKEYSGSESAITLINDENTWKLSLKDEYLPLAEKLMPSTELTRGVVETLALIAWKAPILQSEVVQLRSPVVYDHIHELEQMGLISRAQKGRSYIIKLTEKFHDYFDLPADKAEEIFQSYQEPQAETPEPPITIEQEKENYEKLLEEIKENKINPEELIKKDKEFLDEFEQKLDEIGQRSDFTKTELDKIEVSQEKEVSNEENIEKKEENNEGSN